MPTANGALKPLQSTARSVLVKLRVRHPKTPPADIDFGPCLARLSFYDAMRKHLDLALSNPRRVPTPVHLEQPK